MYKNVQTQAKIKQNKTNKKGFAIETDETCNRMKPAKCRAAMDVSDGRRERTDEIIAVARCEATHCSGQWGPRKNRTQSGGTPEHECLWL